MSTLTVKHCLEIPLASLDDNKGDADRIIASLKERTGVSLIEFPLDIVKTVPSVIHSCNGTLTITVLSDGDRLRTVSIEAGDTTNSHFGLAVDMGTTVVAAELIDLNTERSIASAGETNEQVEYGEDLLTRLHYAGQGGVFKLQDALVDTINKLIGEVCTAARIDPFQITAISAAGNTTMTHLLLGIDPSPIRREPYTPVINHVPILRAEELGLKVAPQAPVYVFPSVGSYLGGDLVAGALAAGIVESDDVSLLLDIGTNGEMILGNKDWLLAGAGAAGPALEGGVVECAMRAKPDAIDRVKIDMDTFEPSYSVIGNEPPVGFCGSGLIDVIAQLYLTGLLDSTGRFLLDKKTARWQRINDSMAFILAYGDKTGSHKPIYITEKDIQNVLRTKAAMVAALTLLLDSVGLLITDIQHIYTAGSFGIHLSVDSATAIGLYPRLPSDRFISLGNGSLRGAREVLLNAEKIRDAENLADSITYVELNVHPGFMGIFRSAKYI